MSNHDDAFEAAPVHQKNIAERDQASREQAGRGTAADHHLLQLQRLAGNAAVAHLVQEDDGDMVRRAVSGGGATIEPVLRQQMEAAMGQDFSTVRVHTGGEAAMSAQRLQANAYTVGNDVVFAPGRYDPGSTSGRRTLAHELTHVVQQRSGPVEGAATGTGVKVSDPGDRFERAAETNANQVMAGLQTETASEHTTSDGTGAPTIQREELPEEEMQG